ncbi:MAG: NAD(P)-dependent oxidoreductase, partial [Candidatus Competibacteraceae bacterium]|nr:NAD(P)-dependent oxidoreductase [Candidatus Competibacteraceae bacterium]
RTGLPLEISPLLINIFKDGQARYGDREWSPNIIKRLEEHCQTDIRASGFPAQMMDDEPEAEGYEVIPTGRSV